MLIFTLIIIFIGLIIFFCIRHNNKNKIKRRNELIKETFFWKKGDDLFSHGGYYEYELLSWDGAGNLKVKDIQDGEIKYIDISDIDENESYQKRKLKQKHDPEMRRHQKFLLS